MGTRSPAREAFLIWDTKGKGPSRKGCVNVRHKGKDGSREQID